MGTKTYLKISCKLLYYGFPGHEAFYEDICWFQILELDVFLDETLVPGHWGAISAATACSRVRAGDVGLLLCGEVHDGGERETLELSCMSLTSDKPNSVRGVQTTHNKADVALNTYHELRNTEPRHLPRRNARFAPLLLSPALPCLWISPLVARKIPFEDPLVLNYVRLGYVVSQLVMLGVYYYVSMTVRLLSSHIYLVLWPFTRSNEKMTRQSSNMAGQLFFI